MNIIWYNTITKTYQGGSVKEYRFNHDQYPKDILALERVPPSSGKNIDRIVAKLNKNLNRLEV